MRYQKPSRTVRIVADGYRLVELAEVVIIILKIGPPERRLLGTFIRVTPLVEASPPIVPQWSSSCAARCSRRGVLGRTATGSIDPVEISKSRLR